MMRMISVQLIRTKITLRDDSYDYNTVRKKKTWYGVKGDDIGKPEWRWFAG